MLILSGIRVDAASVSGKISNEKGEPLGFASVYAEGTALGTTATADGFYKPELKPGKYSIIFRHVGYKTLEKSIEVSTENISLDVQLEQQNVILRW
ncbi:MAG TPA: carboxypeptidase-like regulatory domain-containing protein [Bacteroidia bacterium]|nr:carboxypeptidase-like regulatory domain-containing protein [Bacteroidia bacterium]